MPGASRFGIAERPQHASGTRALNRLAERPDSSTPVSTTDALKAAALLIILIDHIGHYLLPDLDLLRVIGRLGAPIFFFLIGFAKTRDVPMRWLWLGGLLTAIDYLWTGSLAASQLSILFSFAALRLVLPLIERFVLPSTWRIAGLVILLMLLTKPAALLIEYATSGWLFALLGLLHRRVLDEGEGWSIRRDGVGFAAMVFYIVAERSDYGFSTGLTVLLVLGMAGWMITLCGFRRTAFAWQPTPIIGRFLQFCGRYSLEIYAAQIILLASLGAVWSIHSENEVDREDDV